MYFDQEKYEFLVSEELVIEGNIAEIIHDKIEYNLEDSYESSVEFVEQLIHDLERFKWMLENLGKNHPECCGCDWKFQASARNET